MNPVFIICVFGIAFLIWVSIAFLFPGLGKAIEIWFESFKYISKNDPEEDEEDE